MLSIRWKMSDTLPSNLLQFLKRICAQYKLFRPIFEQLEYHISMLEQETLSNLFKNYLTFFLDVLLFM